jgi:two-component system response regulator RegX3
MTNRKDVPLLLIISENAEIRELWAAFFLKQYDVVSAKPEASAASIDQRWPDLVLVDHPGEGSADLSLCRTLRRLLSVPLVFLVENQRESHLLALYQAGADECIPKPVSPLIVKAKIKVWLRYTFSNYVSSLESLETGNWRLVPHSRELYCNSEVPIHLTNLEFRLLHILMMYANKSVSVDFLVDRLWGKNNTGDAVQLKNLVYRLRRKIEPNPDTPCYLLTLPNTGYSLRINR